MISTGMAGKISTITAHGQRIARAGDNLPPLSRNPENPGPATMDSAAAVKVPIMPGST